MLTRLCTVFVVAAVLGVTVRASAASEGARTDGGLAMGFPDITRALREKPDERLTTEIDACLRKLGEDLPYTPEAKTAMSRDIHMINVVYRSLNDQIRDRLRERPAAALSAIAEALLDPDGRVRERASLALDYFAFPKERKRDYRSCMEQTVSALLRRSLLDREPRVRVKALGGSICSGERGTARSRLR